MTVITALSDGVVVHGRSGEPVVDALLRNGGSSLLQCGGVRPAERRIRHLGARGEIPPG